MLLTYGPQVVRVELLGHLAEALQTRPVEHAAAEYASCMAEAGYEIRTPRAAYDIGVRRFGDDPHAGPAERRLAVADAVCQRRSRVYGVISAALADLGEAVLFRRGPFIERLLRLLRTAELRAGTIARWPIAFRRGPE